MPAPRSWAIVVAMCVLVLVASVAHRLVDADRGPVGSIAHSAPAPVRSGGFDTTPAPPPQQVIAPAPAVGATTVTNAGLTSHAWTDGYPITASRLISSTSPTSPRGTTKPRSSPLRI